MILIILNGAFAAGLFFFSMRAVRQGWPFLKHGWLMMQTQTSDPNFRQDVERRRSISDGGRFLIGGILWLAAGMAAFVAAIYFTIQAYTIMYGGGQ